MMDAGVPLSAPVAGIAMGLIMDEASGKYAILSDIAGAEDHYGDMDFKVAGTAQGITALQMDIKVTGITAEIMREALEQARAGRLHILGKMAETLGESRTSVSSIAPRIVTIKIPVDKIRDVIGPGGKMIRSIIERTGVKIDVEDDGRVNVASADEAAAQKAIGIIQELTATPELNKTYMGKVQRITDFGAFVEIMPGTDGLLHVSEIANHRVKDVRDELKEGEQVLVKVINIDPTGKIRLSRKALLNEGAAPKPAPSRPPARLRAVADTTGPVATIAAATATDELPRLSAKPRRPIQSRRPPASPWPGPSQGRRCFDGAGDANFPSGLDPSAAAGRSPAAGGLGRRADRSGCRAAAAGLHTSPRASTASIPPRLEVDQNDLVKITLTSADIAHSFTVDGYRIAKRVGPGPDRHLRVPRRSARHVPLLLQPASRTSGARKCRASWSSIRSRPWAMRSMSPWVHGRPWGHERRMSMAAMPMLPMDLWTLWPTGPRAGSGEPLFERRVAVEQPLHEA